MKIQVRNGCFETNSSSQHSLVVMKDEGYYTPEEISQEIYFEDDQETGEEDCVWDISGSELYFGREPFRALATFADKWQYACASLVIEYNDETCKMLVDLAKKYVPGLKKVVFPMDFEVVPKKTEENKDDDYIQKRGMTEDEFEVFLNKQAEKWDIDVNWWNDRFGNFRYEKPSTGRVDKPFLSHFLKKEKITVEEFLTNRKYIIIQDGDETCYYGGMKRAGLINMDAIDHEIPEDNE